MSVTTEFNAGEVKVVFTAPEAGKYTFEQLGIPPQQLETHGGFLRMNFDFSGIGEHRYYQVPTVEITYNKDVGETHWQCDFNESTILDKMDHHGHSTVLLLNRKKLSAAEHHHQNQLVVHGEFPEDVVISATDSYVRFFN